MPDEITGRELDREVRAELSGLGAHGSGIVARHLVMIGLLVDDDPDAAWEHAVAARARGARLAVVREAVGIAAYRTGRYAEALAELRTVRRITGSQRHLPVMADCERGLGRPERALTLATGPEAADLPLEERMELAIVVSGARADLGQPEAAVLAVQLPELEGRGDEPWRGRLRAAYATALARVGRAEESQRWAERAGTWWQDEDEDDLEEFEILELDDLAEFDDLAELEDDEAPAGTDTTTVDAATVQDDEPAVDDDTEETR